MPSYSSAVALFFCCIALHSALARTVRRDASDIVGATNDNASNVSSSDMGGGRGSGGSGSGSGSGSGRGWEKEEGVCDDALTSEEDEGDDVTSSTAYTAVACHLFCMHNISTDSQYQSAEFGNRDIGGVWRFQFFQEFTQQNWQHSCPALEKFSECVRGCLVRVEPETADLTWKECRTECKEECDEEHNLDSQLNTYCSIDCNRTNCRQGCDNYGRIKRSLNTPGSPPRPVSAPVLTISGEAQQFSVSLSHAAPPTNDQEHPLSPVGVVYRIQDKTTQVTRFLAQVDPGEPLSLDEYACRSVSVSFVVVNMHGASPESPALSLTVQGVVHAEKPTDIHASTEVDKRPSFFGHAVVTISWQHPPGYVPGLYHYIVKIARINYRDSNYSSSPLTTTTLTVQSETTDDEIFILGGHLDILVYSVVGEDERFEEKTYIVPKFENTGTTAVEITDCISQWNGSMFDFTLHWRVPEFIAYGSGIFNDFHLDANSKHDGKTLSLLGSVTILKQPNQTSYVYTWRNFEPQPSLYNYEFGVSIQWTDSEVYARPGVGPYSQDSCEYPATPPPPSPVLSVVLSEPSVGDNIQFTFQWEPPVSTNGGLKNYLACLGGRELNQYEEYDPAAQAEPGDENDTKCLNISKTSSSRIWNHRTPRPDCLYFQMRADSLYRSGNWSEVVVISLSTEGECRDDNLTTTKQSSRSNVVQPVVIGIGVMVVVILLVTMAVITVVCTNVRRRKVRLQRILKRQRSDEADLMFTGGKKKLFKPDKELLITTDEWEIPPNQVIIEDNLGEGAFGEVLKGTVKGPLSNPLVPGALKNAICIPVAIKILKTSAKGSERRDFLQEIEMMKKVSEGQNPHVVSMVGCVTIQEPLSLIMEFIPYGNLLQYLRTNQKLYTDSEVVEDNPYVGLGNVSSPDLISFAYQIASGMDYLSSLGIVHRDLASRNILVGEGKVLKITDLGMSRETDEVYVQKTKGRVPLKWMAVESIITREFTSASDVWAYGVVLWEIGTLGGFPYPSIQNEDLLPQLKRGYRMEKPDNCSTEVYAIMLECWQEDPGKRPTFSKLRARFDSMLLAEKKDTYIDLQIDASKPYYNPDLSDSDPKQNDGLLHVGKTSKSSSRVSITSPFHFRGASPSHSDCSEPPITLRGRRSPRSLSPVPVAEKLPRPASLQLLTSRKNTTNHYVDDPSTRRSIHITSPEWALNGGASDGSVPVEVVDTWNGAAGGGGARRGDVGRDGSAVPDIFISLS